MNFRDFLEHDINEMAIAMKGDWSAKEEMGSISKFVLNKDWEIKDTIGDNELWKHKKTNAWVLGHFKEYENEEKERFGIIFRIDFTNQKNIGNKFNLKKLYNVDEVGVHINNRGFGISTDMYRYFIKKHQYNIIGDQKQFFGARKLWSKLSKSLDLTVDIINISTNEILEENTIIYHGDLDHEFDDRVWSYGIDKKDIRLVLKDIK